MFIDEILINCTGVVNPCEDINFRRNLIEMSASSSDDGNSKSDRYRASKMKLNEEYVIVCDLDMRNLVSSLYKKYEKEIPMEEIEYYRRNLKPSRLQQQMIEIYFYNYTSSAQEFALLKNIDWFKLLLITANITENPVGEKVYLKDTKYLKDNSAYNMLVNRYYKTIVDINEDIIKKFLITFINSKYQFVLYEHPELYDKEISMNKQELVDQLLDFLIMSNTSISVNLPKC